MRTRSILYEQEVLAFLHDFLYSGGGDAAPHTPPTSLAGVIDDIDNIWDDVESFLKPVQLRKKLLKEYLQDDHEEEIINLSGLLGRMRFEDRDPMTGYMRKTELGIISGLSHLYARITDEPCAIIELDYSNMGGTNDFFAGLIAQAEGIDIQDVDKQRAEILTDKVAGLIAEIVLNELQKSGSADTVILPVRAGGDELRIIATDIPPKEFKKIQMRVHHQIEMTMAALGLMGHEHKKYPDNPYKTGFGAAIAVTDLRRVDPANYSERADKQIDIEKQVLGYFRRGEAPPLDVAAQSNFAGNAYTLADEDCSTEMMLVQNAAFKKQSYKKAMQMAGTSPNIPAKERLENIEKKLASNALYTDYKDEKTYMPPSILMDAPPFLLDSAEYNPALLYMNVAEDYEWRLVHLLEEENIDADPYEMEMLHAALMGLTPLDPAAGVLTPRDMPRQLEIYLRDAAVHIAHLLPKLAEETKLPAARKNGPLHNALRKAHKLPDDLKDIKPVLFGVAFHNLAGLNKVFGHDNANKALRFMAQNVIKDTVLEAGFDEDDYALAHEGGAAFTIIFKPIKEDDKGFYSMIGSHELTYFQNEIEQRIEDLNALTPREFMSVLDMAIEDESALDGFGMETMADLPDQKHRKWVNGMHVTCEYIDLSGRDFVQGQTRTGKMLYELRDTLDKKVEHDRALYKMLFEYRHPDQKQPEKTQKVTKHGV